MRHGDKVNNLSRTAAHRRALLANLAISLIEHKRITTTLAKAKALRVYIEPLVTKARENTTHQRRVVFSYLQNKEAIKELFGPIAEKIGERPGGYTRVIKLGFRRGDGAETALIEFVDFNETYAPNAGKVKQAKKTRRGGKKAVAVSATEAPVVVAEEAIADSAEAIEEVVTAPVEAAEEAVAEVVETAEETVAETAAVAEEVVEEAAAATEEVVAEVTEVAEEAATEEAPSEEEKKDEEA
jgi:large subunit ribosomal protein L17